MLKTQVWCLLWNGIFLWVMGGGWFITENSFRAAAMESAWGKDEEEEGDQQPALLPPSQGEKDAVTTPTPDLAPTAYAAVLMERSSGRVLYAKRPHEPRLVASITKIMTAIIALEHGHWDDIVTVPPYAVGAEGSSIYLRAGEKVPLGSLLYGLLFRSGNDAAIAIADHIGQSIHGFVYLMNEKLQHLGLCNTQFQNPHGLNTPGHYGSAYDFAKIAAYALHNNNFRKIVSSQVAIVPWPDMPNGRKFYNKNKLLRLYPWADGVKTGYTKRSGRTLVSSATKNGMQLVAVTLNDGNDWRDAINMFEYGFLQYRLRTLVRSGQILPSFGSKDRKWPTDVGIAVGGEFSYPLSSEEENHVEIRPVIAYPFSRLQGTKNPIGRVRIALGQQSLGSVPLHSVMRQRSLASCWHEVVSRAVVRGRDVP
ncbi:D-alanyl-D-alanine carboxypeptidase family protein [Pasteuria penetrans]|uniref:D-alanyl-D-alanine carboxypeptidase family protein n=1 Tax=Pasteuria penetrans TaxID=86005 RepID=UPI00165B9F49|nr:D-alanyl-D-alanine carboxypeptidase family protein [Pasteuria penetrans]